MQNNNDIDKILNSRSFQETNLQSLNSKITSLAAQTPQEEFEISIVKVNSNVKIIAILACFLIGIFTGFSLEIDAVSNDFVEYVYIEEGIV